MIRGLLVGGRCAKWSGASFRGLGLLPGVVDDDTDDAA